MLPPTSSLLLAFWFKPGWKGDFAPSAVHRALGVSLIPYRLALYKGLGRSATVAGDERRDQATGPLYCLPSAWRRPCKQQGGQKKFFIVFFPPVGNCYLITLRASRTAMANIAGVTTKRQQIQQSSNFVVYSLLGGKTLQSSCHSKNWVSHS